MSNDRILNVNNLKDRRRELRSKQTYAEERLWHFLRNKKIDGHKFFRQYSIGPCVVDFCCPKSKLVIEIDGKYHEANSQQMSDAERSEYLEGLGFRVIRFTNDQVDYSPINVCANIQSILQEPPHL